MATFATMADLKAELNINSSASDGELWLRLDAATEVVASLVGDFSEAPKAEVVTAWNGTVILSRRPAGVVTLSAGGAAVTGFTLDANAGLLHGVTATGPLVATYAASTGTVPAAVTLATLIIAGHLWETQRGSSPTQLLQGDVPDAQPGLGYAVPSRARELLQPYIKQSAGIA